MFFFSLFFFSIFIFGARSRFEARMLRRKPFRLVLADTPSDLYQELEAQKESQKEELSSIVEPFLTPEKAPRSSLSVHQRIGFEPESPPPTFADS